MNAMHSRLLLLLLLLLFQVPGEDLTPYRAASRDIRAVLSRCARGTDCVYLLAVE
jgi:hypothetical protein